MGESSTGLRRLPSPDDIRQLLRARVAEADQEVLEEEIALLGSRRYERTRGRGGYRHGSERRRVTTENGAMTLRVPRARVTQADGSRVELRSSVLARYQRRRRQVDEAILGAYLAGANTRRIRCRRLHRDRHVQSPARHHRAPWGRGRHRPPQPRAPIAATSARAASSGSTSPASPRCSSRPSPAPASVSARGT